jgi:hypothetical protein
MVCEVALSDTVATDGLLTAKLLIASYIPDVIALLKDSDLNIQDAVSKVLSILAGHGALNWSVFYCSH